MDRREFLVGGAAALATTGCVAESARMADAGVETPTANKAGCQLVISGHQHRYRYDGPVAGRSWAHIVGGGPELGVSSRVVDGKRVQVEDESRFPTVVEGFVEGGRLRVRVHNVLSNSIAGEFAYAPRGIDFRSLT